MSQTVSPDTPKPVTMQNLLAIQHRSLPEQVAEAIVSGIATGVFPAGRLQEPSLVETLQVSRVPIREAIRVLEAQGILVSEPQKGHRIVAFDAQRVADCYMVRRAIEATAVLRAAARLRVDPSLDVGLRGVLAQMRAHLGRGDALGMYRADLDFHSEVYRLAGNELFISLWRGLRRHFLIIFAIEVHGRPETLQVEYDQHARLLETMLTGDDARLTEEVACHLRAAAQ